MNSVFLNYNTSYFDLISNATSVLSPPYGSYNLIKSSNGKLVESNLFLESGDGYSDIKTLVPSIGFGTKSSYNIAFKNIDIGYWSNGGSYYPESSLKVNIYPTTTFNQGLKFTQNPSRYNSSDLWISGNGVMKYRDRNVVSSGDGAISGNLAVFGSDTIGAIEDSGISILKGSITLTLRDNNTTPGNYTTNIDFYYQKIGKCVNLTLKKKLFQGKLLGNPTGLTTSLNTSGFPFPDGLLPTFLQPIDE